MAIEPPAKLLRSPACSPSLSEVGGHASSRDCQRAILRSARSLIRALRLEIGGQNFAQAHVASLI